MTLRKFDDLENESDARYEKLITARSRAKIAERFDTAKPNHYPGDEALQFLKEKVDDIVDEANALRTASGSLSTRTTANDAKVSMVIGSGASQAMAGNTTTISGAQASAITANSAKTGITTSQANAITANTAKVGLNVTSGFSLSFSVSADEEGKPTRLQIRVTNNEIEDAEATGIILNLS